MKDRIQTGRDAIKAGFATTATADCFATVADAKAFIDSTAAAGIEMPKELKAKLWESTGKDVSLFTVKYAVHLLNELIKCR